ncbi:hypothetical protein B0H11DRAFT_1908000 [Mycena galericulata]|nr:hypothetical protein B0H11DRAFT_1908000 [Mycena galericulata]
MSQRRTMGNSACRKYAYPRSAESESGVLKKIEVGAGVGAELEVYIGHAGAPTRAPASAKPPPIPHRDGDKCAGAGLVEGVLDDAGLKLPVRVVYGRTCCQIYPCIGVSKRTSESVWVWARKAAGVSAARSHVRRREVVAKPWTRKEEGDGGGVIHHRSFSAPTPSRLSHLSRLRLPAPRTRIVLPLGIRPGWFTPRSLKLGLSLGPSLLGIYPHSYDALGFQTQLSQATSYFNADTDLPTSDPLPAGRDFDPLPQSEPSLYLEAELYFLVNSVLLIFPILNLAFFFLRRKLYPLSSTLAIFGCTQLAFHDTIKVIVAHESKNAPNQRSRVLTDFLQRRDSDQCRDWFNSTFIVVLEPCPDYLHNLDSNSYSQLREYM